MNRQHTLAKSLAFAAAAFVTVAMLGSIDVLAFNEHAAVQMARAASAPADVALAKALPGKRS